MLQSLIKITKMSDNMEKLQLKIAVFARYVAKAREIARSAIVYMFKFEKDMFGRAHFW